jgi:hypothetical protein
MRGLCVPPVVIAVVALAAGCGVSTGSARGVFYDIRPGDDLFGTLAKLHAGDHVLIHAGTYLSAGRIGVRWAGTAAAPIVIRGAPGEARPVIVGTPAQNVLDVSGSYFVLSGVELRGGSQGVRLGDVNHAILAGLVIHDLVDVGISCDRPGSVCRDVTIRDSAIYDTGHDGTGEGIYLGCQSADCVFKNGIIERNVIHDTGQRKGDGIQIKPGSFGNTIGENVIYRTTYPGVTIYECRDPIDKPHLVEGNTTWRTGGILVLERALVRGNRVLSPNRSFRARLRCP